MPELLVVSAVLIVIMLVQILPGVATVLIADMVVLILCVRRVRRDLDAFPPPRWILHLKFFHMRWWSWWHFFRLRFRRKPRKEPKT
jgi:hypothetical protein